MLAILVSDKLSQKINLEKALKMALIHDLPEIIAGDPSPMGTDGTGKDTYYSKKEFAKEKYEKEKIAAKKIFDLLPKKEGTSLYELWLEYEKRECFEAKAIKALDAIECSLQIMEYRKGYVFPKHLTFNIDYVTKHAKVDPFLQDLANYVAVDMKTKYKEFKK